MSTKKQIEKDPEVQIEEALSKSEKFIEKNGKVLLVVVAVAALVVGSIFGYDHFYATPRSEEASAKMYEAQIQFERDSFQVALNGIDGVLLGFEDITTEYSGTPEGNVAAHYAGVCKVQLGDFQGALTTLESYEHAGSIAGAVLDAQNYGLMGDCHIELGNSEKAIEMYKKAMSTDASVAPLYGQKAAIAMYEAGKASEAIEVLQTIKEQYPRSTQARDADKYINYMEQSL